MSLLWIAWAGFAASALAAAVFAIARGYGLTQFTPTTQLGCLFFEEPRLPMTETVGLAVHLVLGSTLIPAIYAGVLPWMGGPGWVSGLLLGLLHGGAVIAALPAMGKANRAVRAGRLPAPGRWGMGWGARTPYVIMGAALLYGAVTGAILGAARTPGDANLAVSTHAGLRLVAITVQATLQGEGRT